MHQANQQAAAAAAGLPPQPIAMHPAAAAVAVPITSTASQMSTDLPLAPQLMPQTSPGNNLSAIRTGTTTTAQPPITTATSLPPPSPSPPPPPADMDLVLSSSTTPTAATPTSTSAAATADGPVDGAILAPIAAQVEEPQYTRKKIKEFLTHHSAYELIPESGKVVLLDVDLPLRQAFHALHEQGLASAPIYCSESGSILGIISASDFIATLQRLRSMVSTSSNPMSEMEMDQHTIRGLREELSAEGRPPKSLVHVSPKDSLAQVVRTMYDNHCSMAPVLRAGPTGQEANIAGILAGGVNNVTGGEIHDGPEVLHTSSLAGVLACLMRHFRASLASLPLLAQPLHTLPVGTWTPESSVVKSGAVPMVEPVTDLVQRRGRRIVAIKVVYPNTPLTEALGVLLETGISCLPVVDAVTGALIDIYVRADITMLAKSNAYNRLQFEDVTVGQALALTAEPGPPPQLAVTQPTAPPQWPSPNSSQTSMQDASMGPTNRQRVHVCTSQDALRFVVERLAIPGVRRVIVVQAETRRVEGIVSLSDIASFMLL